MQTRVQKWRRQVMKRPPVSSCFNLKDWLTRKLCSTKTIESTTNSPGIPIHRKKVRHNNIKLDGHKHVTFNTLVKTFIIPNRYDFGEELLSELFWQRDDFTRFKVEAINEMKSNWLKKNILLYAVKRSSEPNLADAQLREVTTDTGLLTPLAMHHVDSVNGFPFANDVVYSPTANVMAVSTQSDEGDYTYKVISHVDSMQKLLIDKNVSGVGSNSQLPYDLLKYYANNEYSQRLEGLPLDELEEQDEESTVDGLETVTEEDLKIASDQNERVVEIEGEEF